MSYISLGLATVLVVFFGAYMASYLRTRGNDNYFLLNSVIVFVAAMLGSVAFAVSAYLNERRVEQVAYLDRYLVNVVNYEISEKFTNVTNYHDLLNAIAHIQGHLELGGFSELNSYLIRQNIGDLDLTQRQLRALLAGWAKEAENSRQPFERLLAQIEKDLSGVIEQLHNATLVTKAHLKRFRNRDILFSCITLIMVFVLLVILLRRVSSNTMVKRHFLSQLERRNFALDQNGIVFMLDKSGRFIYSNEKFTHEFFYSFKEIKGRRLDFLFLGANSEQVFHAIWASMAKGAAWQGELQCLTGHGDRVCLEASITPFSDENGALDQVVVILYDVTTRKNAEQSLRDSQERFRGIVDTMSDWVWEVDLEPRYLFCYGRVGEILGYEPDELVGRPVYDFMVPEDIPRFEQAFRRLVEHDEPIVNLESWRVSKTGKRVCLLTKGVPLHDEQGNVIGYRGCGSDITEMKLAENALRESEQQLSAILTNLQDMFFRFDNNGICTYISPSVKDLLGITPDELLGRNIQGSPELDRQFTVLADKLRSHDGVLNNFDLLLRHKDGYPVTVSCNVKYYFDESNNVMGMEGLARDVTDVRLSEARARLFATLVKQTDEIILVADNKGNVQYANPAYEAKMAVKADELNGTRLMMLDEVGSGAGGASVWQQLQEGESWWGKITQQNEKGEQIILEASVTPIRDLNGIVSNFVLIGRDITREVQLEERFRQSQKMEAIGTLAGGIAHDFNNMLAVMLGFMQLALDESKENEKIAGYLQSAVTAGDRAKQLVAQILTFSRQHHSEVTDVKVAPLIEEVLAMVSATLPSFIQIESQIANPDATVRFDITELHQVFMNLLINAAQAIGDSPGIIRATCGTTVVDAKLAASLGEIPAGEYACITVSDTGCGMSEAVKARIFEPFFTTKEVGSGTGMGLATVHGLLANHGGTITVDSEPGEGSQFTIYIPSVDGMAGMEKVANTSALPTLTARILLVDDEPMLLKVTTRILERAGHEVIAFSDAQAALSYFRRNVEGVDCVITDQSMPQITGTELAQRIHEVSPGCPVILCTGFSDSVTADNFQEVNVQRFFYKPVDARELIDAIAALV